MQNGVREHVGHRLLVERGYCIQVSTTALSCRKGAVLPKAVCANRGASLAKHSRRCQDIRLAVVTQCPQTTTTVSRDHANVASLEIPKITLSTITPIYTAPVSVYDSNPTDTYDVDNASAGRLPYPRPPRAEWLEIKGTKLEEQFKLFEQEHGEGRVLYQGTR